MNATVRDARPPALLIHVLNPVMRLVLRSPLGRMVPALALLEFRGRRSGCRYRVPVGWHAVDGRFVVFTPAPWRANFRAATNAIVHHRGRMWSTTAVLVTHPAEVAEALQSVVAETSARSVGLDVPTGHVLSTQDVVAVDRAMLRFDVE